MVEGLCALVVLGQPQHGRDKSEEHSYLTLPRRNERLEIHVSITHMRQHVHTVFMWMGRFVGEGTALFDRRVSEKRTAGAYSVRLLKETDRRGMRGREASRRAFENA